MHTTSAKSLSAGELFRRYLLFIVSLFIMAVGVAVTKRGELGVSPISSVANVLSLRFSALSLGNWLILWNCALILGQILVLRKRFQWFQLLQLPLSFLFGYFTDFAVWLASFLPAGSYLARLCLVFCGTLILSVGVSLSVIADVIMNSGEAFVKAVSDTIQRDFGSVKICFDVGCVVLAVLLSLALCGWTVVGTREGTVIAALCTGWLVKQVRPRLHPLCDRLLRPAPEENSPSLT